MKVSATSVKVGKKVTVTLQPEDAAGNKVTEKKLDVAFALGSGTGQGTFGKVKYNSNGTYTATFTATTAGSNTITATIGGQAVTLAAPTITVTEPASPAVITTQAEIVAVGGAIAVARQAEDANENADTSGGL